ncbi:MAG: hypothetical protein DRI86_16135 [Bacteroidetes bacterium]|nr:MAG: hypothetical protein DRI86_16135 [Bacteroidota bacterium]
MISTKEQAIWVSPTITQPGGSPDFETYQIQDRQIPKEIQVDDYSVLEPTDTILVDTPYFSDLSENLQVVFKFDPAYNNIIIDIYKNGDYWYLMDSIITPKINADTFLCNSVSLYKDKFVVSTTQWTAPGSNLKHKSYFYTLNATSNTWVLTETIETLLPASVKIYKDQAIVYNNHKISIYKYDGIWALDTEISNLNLNLNSLSDISMHDDVFIIGATEDEAAYIYDYSGSWVETRLQPNGMFPFKEYGTSVSFNSNTEVLVTSMKGTPEEASITVYENTGTWNITATLLNADGLEDGSYIRVKDNNGITEGLNTIMYLEKKLNIWEMRPLPNSDGLGGLNKCSIDSNISACDYGGNKIQFFEEILINNKTNLKTPDLIQSGSKGLIYDGISLKSGTYGNRFSNGTVDVTSFSLENPGIKAFYKASELYVCITDTPESNISYNKPLNITSITDTQVFSTETVSGLLAPGDHLRLQIGGEWYTSRITLVQETPAGPNFDYVITFESKGVPPTDATIKSKGLLQYPEYSWDSLTDTFLTSYRNISQKGRSASYAVVGDTDNIEEKVQLDLYSL